MSDSISTNLVNLQIHKFSLCDIEFCKKDNALLNYLSKTIAQDFVRVFTNKDNLGNHKIALTTLSLIIKNNNWCINKAAIAFNNFWKGSAGRQIGFASIEEKMFIITVDLKK